VIVATEISIDSVPIFVIIVVVVVVVLLLLLLLLLLLCITFEGLAPNYE